MSKELKSHILEYLSSGFRLDGRKLTDIRDLEINTDVVKTAEGSARVKLGKTEVFAGVKFELGKPYPDIPEEGTMSVNLELLPLSSPDFESGPPNEYSVEMARIVDRGIRESKTIDTKSLCVTKGELVWTILIDICPINDNGNILDTAGIAALAALKSARFPERDGDQVNYKKLSKEKLKLSKEPIPVTVYKIGKHLIVDPLVDEQDVADARLTVTTTADGTICALQKGGVMPLTPEEIEQMADIAIKKSKEIRKLV